MTLEWLPGRYAVCRLDPHAPLPEWVLATDAPARLLSITRTEREVSIVIDESRLLPPPALDPATPIERGFAALRIAGTLDFSLVGILARLTGALAAASVSVFALSTYDTDILLVREDDAQRAEAALRGVAHIVSRDDSSSSSSTHQ